MRANINHFKPCNIDEFFENIEKYSKLNNEVVVWMGLRSGDYSTVKFINPDLVASTRYGVDTLEIESRIPVISTEKQTKVRTDSSMHELDSQLDEIITRSKELGSAQVYFVCYHSTEALERIALRNKNLHILNPPAQLKEYLDKKSVVRKELKKRGVNVIPGIEGIISKEMFDVTARKFDVPFIVSLDSSAAGCGVYIINRQSDFNELEEANRGKPASFMKYIGGKSMSISAARTRDYVIFSEPSLQIIGQKNCSLNRFGWCGNDFNISSKISEEELKKMFSITEKTGKWLKELGYLGIFGIDFIADNKDVYFTELNPRFLGTSSILVDRQIEMGIIPLSFFHLVPYMEGLYLNDEFVDAYNSAAFQMKKPLNVSQIVLHNLTGRDCILKSAIAPGRYSFDDERLTLEWKGTEQFLSQSPSYDDVIITGDIPISGTTIRNDGDEICKIYTYDDVLDTVGVNLKDSCKRLVDTVYSQFDMMPK